jgi:hypothetical protein
MRNPDARGLKLAFQVAACLSPLAPFPPMAAHAAPDGRRVVPMACATCDAAVPIQLEARPLESPDSIAVAADNQFYEVVPGVIRADGSETFRLLVHLGRPVRRVYQSEDMFRFDLSRSEFLDDGTDGDQTAGDGVYTSGVFTLNPPTPPIRYLTSESETLEGMTFEDTGAVTIEETDGSEVEFLIEPCVGLIDPSIPDAPFVTPAGDIQISSHLVNIQSSGFAAAQRMLHLLGATPVADAQSLVNRLYETVPDHYDFLVILSAMHGEWLPETSTPNFNAGVHLGAQNATRGIGGAVFDHTGAWGSAGRLLGVNIVDTARRGNLINNVLHEITHQWAAFLSHTHGLKSDSVHWHSYSNIGSVLGGYGWISQPDGSWRIDGDQSRSRLRRMANPDRYLAGFIPAGQVPPMMLYDTSTKPPFLRLLDGDPILSAEIVNTVTIGDLLAVEGQRLPTSVHAQRHFNVLFVMESVDRLLTAREMTFYTRLAGEFERILPPAADNPILGTNWVPATRYWAPEATLSSRADGRDSDGDGLFDDWEMTYFGNLSHAAAEDPDHDGATNFEEQAYLRHPCHADARQPIRIDDAGDVVTIEITRFLPLLDYTMEIAGDDLGTPGAWEPAGITTTLGPHLRLEIRKSDIATGAAAPRRFARCRVTGPAAQ